MTELLRFRRDLDIFSYSVAPAENLLRSGLHAPVVITTAGSIVWGWHLVRAASALDVPELPVVAKDLSPGEQVRTALHLENRTGEYALSEQAGILQYAEDNGIEPAEFSLLVTGDGSFAPTARRYLSLCDHGRDLVDSEVVDLKTALRITEATTECLWTFRHALSELSVSNRRMFATLLDEIMRRDYPSRDDCEDLATRALESGQPREYLSTVRYPAYTEMEERFQDLQSTVLAGTGVRLHHPPYFEGSKFRVEFEFGSETELLRRLDDAQRLRSVSHELFGLL